MLRLGVLLSLLSLALATPAPRTMRVHTRRDSAPAGYTLAGAASPDTTIRLRIALAQSNPAGLEDALYDVSTPSSANYGKYLTREEVRASSLVPAPPHPRLYARNPDPSPSESGPLCLDKMLDLWPGLSERHEALGPNYDPCADF